VGQVDFALFLMTKLQSCLFLSDILALAVLSQRFFGADVVAELSRSTGAGVG
jgi:hypothetical protein